MNLELLLDGTPNEKPWANLVVSSVACNNVISVGGTFGTITATNIVGPITSSNVTLNEEFKAPIPAPGQINLYSNLIGQLQTVQSNSTITKYIGNDGAVPMSGPLTLNNASIAMGAQWTMTPPDGPIVTNTIVESTLLNATGSGNLVLGANSFPSGSSLHFIITMFVATTNGADTCTVNFNLNGGSFMHFVIGGAPLVNTRFRIQFEILNGDGVNTESDGVVFQDGAGPVLIEDENSGFNNSIAHTMDLTATWSNANPANQIQCNTFYVTRNF